MFSASELPATAEKEKTSNGSSMYNGFVMPGKPSFAPCTPPPKPGMAFLDSEHLGENSPEPSHRSGRPILYGMRYCPYSQRAMLVAAKKNIDIDVVNINLDSKPSWFLRKNPLGLVPAIQNKEFVAYESDIVVDYLESKYPEPRLQPESPEDRARDACFLHLFNKKMIQDKFAPFLKSSDPEEFKKAWGGISAALQWMEQQLIERGGFLFGGRYVSLVDLMVYPFFEHLLAVDRAGRSVKMPWDKIPTLSTWMARMATDPAVQKVRCPAQGLARFHESLRRGAPQYDFTKGA